MTDWVLSNMGTTDSSEDKFKHLSILERADLEKMRSCYMFIPSGVNIDTVERFWTYTLLYCSRRNFISEDMPQFYTMEKFEFWKLPYDSLKHFYLLLKLAFDDNNLLKTQFKYKESMSKCTQCSRSDALSNSIDEILRVKSYGPWERFQTKLPFATYSRPQYRGQNVWYGTTDFTLRTMFGNVKHSFLEGKIKTEWYIFQDAYLDQIWHLYKLFCDSRGIEKPSLVYDNTGYQMRRLAFNNLNIPFIPSADDNQLILENSSVYTSDYVEITLQTDWNSRPTYEDEFVDFHIYHIYDINESFFKEHNLTPLKSLLLPKNAIISNSVLMNNFLESKIYNTLMLDKTHKSPLNIKEKYKNIKLLGSLGSFTRALCLADEIGMIKYRSSISNTKISSTILESQTLQDIPIIDLYNSSAMSRVTFQQQKTLAKLAKDETLETRDL
jgi:hypothetical protein